MTPTAPAPRADSADDHLRMLREAVADFVERGGSIARVRTLRGSRPGFDREIWSTMAEFGWLGILLPERYGGLDLGFAEMAIVAEGIGRSLAPEPVCACAVLAGRAILHGDNSPLKQLLLPKLVAGELIPALAWQEHAGNLDCDATDTRAEAVADGVRLNGSKRFVAGAGGADGFIVSARSAQGLAAYWVPAGAPGVALEFEALADGNSYGVLRLDDVQVPASDRVASPDCATEALARARDEATVVTAAELLGVMGRALEITLAYLKTRVQFGRPIGAFQALQHRAVDLYVQQQLARAAVDHSTAALDAGCEPRARSAAASRAKARAADAGLLIARQSIQLHGAIGYTDACDIGLYLKRALVLAAWLGNAALHRRRYAALSLAQED